VLDLLEILGPELRRKHVKELVAVHANQPFL
jgi:hypothetical protein